jgi:hypothetical protein
MAENNTTQITIPPAVTEIAKRAKIKAVNLVQSSCQLVAPPPAPGTPFEVKTELRGGSAVLATESRTIVCSFGASIRPLLADGTHFAEISCDYAIQYEFDDEAFFASMKAADRDAFAAYNTSFQLWPHMREFVQSMAARMTTPPIILPPFRPIEMVGAPDTWIRRPEPT